MPFLPKRVHDVHVPPLKCQGIKTKLVDFISSNVHWSGDGRWIEPFLGSGVVAFNIEPAHAILADANPHIIDFYRGVQSGRITTRKVRRFLEDHGPKLEEEGEDYYYEMRDEFNKNHDPLYLLFLNRSCYNGMMRFNLSGGFNVPFCKKPERFTNNSGAYVTKIVNQVGELAAILEDKDWVFKELDWEETLAEAAAEDFIYLDPPYVGRHTGYVGNWDEEDAVNLAKETKSSPADWALSMWKENKYRENAHLEDCWSGGVLRTFSHFYHVGSTEDLRNEMEEALVIKPGSEAPEEQVRELQSQTGQQRLKAWE